MVTSLCASKSTMRHLQAAHVPPSTGKAAPPSLQSVRATLDGACPSSPGNRGTQAAYIAPGNMLPVKATRADAHATVDDACGASPPTFGAAPDERAAAGR